MLRLANISCSASISTMRKERTSKLIEPDYTEYISALPAGKRTQLMVDAGPSGGISPSTLSLAAAAQQTCGKVICVRHEQADVEVARRQIETLNLTRRRRVETGEIIACGGATQER